MHILTPFHDAVERGTNSVLLVQGHAPIYAASILWIVSIGSWTRFQLDTGTATTVDLEDIIGVR